MESSFGNLLVWVGNLFSVAMETGINTSLKQIPKRFDMEFIGNENVQYFALAFYWYSYHPITGKVMVRCGKAGY